MRVAAVLFIRNVSYRVHRFWHKELFYEVRDYETNKTYYRANSLIDKIRRKYQMTCCPLDLDKTNWVHEFWFWTCENIVERLCYWAERKLEYDYKYRDTD